MRRKIMHWLWRDDRPEWANHLVDPLIDPASRLLCLVCGHQPVNDQCGCLEHDFCVWCRKSMPGQAAR